MTTKSIGQVPVVSICIPTCNGSRYIEDCIVSAISQDLENFEVVIVDNHSSDSTFSIAASYAERDSRIRLERNAQDIGMVGNWIRCIELARGDWIKFLFQDDLIDPTCLTKMMAAAHTGAVMIACRRRIIFNQVNRQARREYERHLAEESFDALFPDLTELSPEDYCETVLDHPGVNFVGEPSAVLLHKSVFGAYGTFNASFVEINDVEYWTRLGINVGLAYVPETLASFRVHPRAVSAVNRQVRRYRREALDPAILHHEFTFNPAFSPLRRAARDRKPPIDLRKKFVKLALGARRRAESSAHDTHHPDGACLQEWRTAAVSYPMLEKSLNVRLQRLRRAPRRWLRPTASR
jgi:glycosyltransferase involved in cell wall biosynthesis